ncbi:MAG: ribbon-helix-helix protein, CopG family [Bryobacteraceae bacterium]|jgi:predicted transcriptional regulator
MKVADHKNVTLSLPEPLLRRFRVYAAANNQSMTALMAEAIRQMIDRNSDSEKAKRRFLDRIRRAPDRHTRGVIRWSREELHER